MIRQPKVFKEMGARDAKLAAKAIIDYMKDTLAIGRYLKFVNTYPATVTLKNPSYMDVTFNLFMSFEVASSDKHYSQKLNITIEKTFIKCWDKVKKSVAAYPPIDIKVRGTSVFISTDNYEVLDKAIKDFCELWKVEEKLIIKEFLS